MGAISTTTNRVAIFGFVESRGLKNMAGCQSKAARFERLGPLLQVALTLIEQTVGAGHARDKHVRSLPEYFMKGSDSPAGAHKVRLRYQPLDN